MPSLHIVLVEPEIPQNTGNIARTCAVTGAALHLVGPMGFQLEDKKLRHAGLDYWPYLTLSTYESLPEFFEKNQGSFFFFSTKAQRRYTDVSYPDAQPEPGKLRGHWHLRGAAPVGFPPAGVLGPAAGL